ncbi:GNAT family N-acetyltransferase [Wenjunlia tyrosinilytica]|uniref:Lysine N-acyltransferase MbtK n=1 Tax=Wenjunlia tyrosinilytica TaxID=1544741 RepID=A0A917ZSE8_9ACTN|nr:GNAT family N-acetyltransferase [Wenjunlia tyrosinilytica]GGO91463.1 N-acetyltransferase [Wenjunlia tyrosinilytica]
MTPEGPPPPRDRADDTLDLHLGAETVAVLPRAPVDMAAPPGDLLDHVAAWGPAATDAGEFEFVPVDLDRDLGMLARWMNDPAVAQFWELEGPAAATERHVRAQLDGDGRSVPCLGVLDGVPMSYWEVYRADLDPIARYYPARPQDTGLHLLIGAVRDRGRGLGATLLRAAADLVLDNRPAGTRVIAEPDLRNTPSVAAFLTAGFRFSAEVRLPEKTAALMIRERALRHRLGPPVSPPTTPRKAGSAPRNSPASPPTSSVQPTPSN